MKNILTRTYVCTAMAALCRLCVSCNNRSSDNTSPASGCRLQNYSLTARSGSSLREEQATYTYDAQGNLLKVDTIWTIREILMVLTAAVVLPYAISYIVPKVL